MRQTPCLVRQTDKVIYCIITEMSWEQNKHFIFHVKFWIKKSVSKITKSATHAKRTSCFALIKQATFLLAGHDIYTREILKAVSSDRELF